LPFSTVQAASGTYYKTFVSSASDGYTQKNGDSYLAAWTATSGTVYSTATTMKIGQIYAYQIARGFVYFDASSLPDGATITAATLSLYVSSDASTTDFDVTVQNGQPTYPHNPLIEGDYYKSYYSDDGGSSSTSTISGGGYWNITLDSTGRGWISKTNETKLCLRSSRDIAGTENTGDEYITVSTCSAGRTYAPLLYITYTVSSTYIYLLYGPFEDAPVIISNSTVTINVFYNASASEVQLLDGTFGTMDTAVISSNIKPLLLTYNISMTGNTSRTIYTSTETGPFYIFVPSANTPCYLYTFNIVDFQGVTHGYLENRIYYNGSFRTVERHELNSLGDIPLYMQWAVAYDMQVTCDQGTLGLGTFTALGTSTANVVIAYGVFPWTYTSGNFTVNALRMNNTWIQMNYTDPASATSWVYLAISHTSDGVTVTDYTTNSSSSTVQANWYNATEITDYIATVSFMYSGTVYTYSFSCASFADIENPWNFIDAPYRYAIAVGLTVGAGCVFSYATIVGGAWGMVGFAAFFAWIGWLPQTLGTWSVIGFGGLISGLITIAEWKKVEREI
jgi:hypothetical protein